MIRIALSVAFCATACRSSLSNLTTPASARRRKNAHGAGRGAAATRTNRVSIETQMIGRAPRAGRIVAVPREAAMTVKAILAAKGGDVVTVEPTANLAAAAGMLAEHRIGALVIVGADRRVVGILSERDIVRALAEQGAAALDRPVSEAMTRKVVTCRESETVAGIMEQMTEGKFRHLPVVDQGRLIGIVSIGDVVKRRLNEIERESAALRDYIQTA
jgi:CBS domain-containing protein